MGGVVSMSSPSNPRAIEDGKLKYQTSGEEVAGVAALALLRWRCSLLSATFTLPLTRSP